MSRVGKKEIPVPGGVTVELNDRTVKVKGPKGELAYDLLPGLELELEDGTARVKQEDLSKSGRAFWGLTRSLINNMVVGVSEGYKKSLELHGTGIDAGVRQELIHLAGITNFDQFFGRRHQLGQVRSARQVRRRASGFPPRL